jgi:levanase/fructan beta-fructosidase
MTNWDYANVVPTQTWRGANTVVRELELVKDNQGYKITTVPVKNLDNYIVNTEVQKKILVKKRADILTKDKIDLTKADISLTMSQLKKGSYTIVVSNEEGDELRFGIDNTKEELFVDRSKSSNATGFHKFTASFSEAKLEGLQKKAKLRFLLDKTSIELFYNDGQKVLTEIFYTKSPFTRLNIESNQNFEIDNLTINQLDFK